MMRLLVLQEDGSLKLVEYDDNNIPDYAILSHTWGPDWQEVTYKDFTEPTSKIEGKAGCKKIEFCKKQANSHGLRHFWLDTCCIDKSSSAELTEAINSMFRWYQRAAKCYVYLSDVSTSGDDTNSQSSSTTWEAEFRLSRWFTRGWTLQELIAPTSVEFFSAEGKRLGCKTSLEREIYEITKIPIEALRGGLLKNFTVNERFSWANNRQTKRLEDQAYSLMGIFGIHMPLIYGERGEAIVRLREAIDGPSLMQEQKREQHRKLTNWISSIDFAAQQSDIIGRRQEGTGVWFTESPGFLRWQQGTNQTLFCPGIPGAGKTMIAAITVDALWKYSQDRDIGVAYIYCNYETQASQTAEHLIATLLKQLIQERSSFAEPVAGLYDLHTNRGTRPSREEILTAFQSVVSKYSQVYVVIDALDECLSPVRIQLLEMLCKIQSTGKLNMMATSRPIPEVVQNFDLSAGTLEVHAREADVKRFVAAQIFRLPAFVQRDDELQNAIKDGISTAVDGMFLLARLHIDSLLDKKTKKKVLIALQNLPKGSVALDEAYNRAIERIEGQLPGDITLAKSVLSWITYAQRPLTTRELCHALAVEEGESELDPTNIPDVEDLISVCAGLVVIDEESRIVRMVHYTTQHYMERIRETWIPRAQHEITTVCLTYLSFDAFRGEDCVNEQEFRDRLKKHTFLDYSSRYLGQHAQTVQEQVYDVVSPFLQDTDLVSHAVQAWEMSMDLFRLKRHENFKSTGLHLTVRLELLHWLEKLLSDLRENADFTVNSKDESGATPLSLAARNGHEAVVKLLLEQDNVKVNSKDFSGQTPLSLAARNGHEAIVKLLLEQDNVEVDSKSYSGRTPLSFAAENGHKAVVKLLLEQDNIKVDSKSYWGRTPLSWAAKNGHKAVVKLLLERDDVVADSKDNEGCTPLSCAIENGHLAVVELLLERDDVVADSKDNNGRTPLSWAAKKGYKAVVKLLLERDVVVADSKDNEGCTPLSCAIENGHLAVVELLLERDDVVADSKDNNGRTPLSWAAKKGYKAVVKLLLERDNVVVDSKDNNGRTPLSWAAEKGYEAVVELLLERDDVVADSKDNWGRTPLWWAEKGEHEAKDIYGQSLLWEEKKRRYEAVVKLLKPQDS